MPATSRYFGNDRGKSVAGCAGIAQQLFGGSGVAANCQGLAPQRWGAPSIAVTALFSLAILGGHAARVGGAKVGPGVLRVTFWSALSMGVASIVGAIFVAT
jgi:hypothetical protein